MTHYTYQITYNNGKKYIGVRTCKGTPENDANYVGSSKYTPNNDIKSKVILKTFSSRHDAVLHEIQLHNKYNVAVSAQYYNRAKQSTTGFDTTGCTNTTCDWMKEASKKKALYSGTNRTLAQIEGTKRMAATNTGVKNLSKGRKGIKSCRFKPWYYITPTGIIHKFTNESISDFILRDTTTPLVRATIYNMTSKHEHQKMTTGRAKGWTVGFLPIPNKNPNEARRKVKAWYYRTPSGIRVDVTNMTKLEFVAAKVIPGLTIGVIKRVIKNNRPNTTKKFKDWMFGNID